MSRCQEAGYSREECMKAHEGHEFKTEADYDDKKKKKGQRQQAYDAFALVESATKGKRARWIQVGNNEPYDSA